MKNIADIRAACKRGLERVPRDGLIVVVLVLTALASFGFGYLAGSQAGQGSVSIEEPAGGATGAFVASISGTRYYPVSCAGASRIADANKVYFATAADAEAAGYQLASGCGN